MNKNLLIFMDGIVLNIHIPIAAYTILVCPFYNHMHIVFSKHFPKLHHSYSFK